MSVAPGYLNGCRYSSGVRSTAPSRKHGKPTIPDHNHNRRSSCCGTLRRLSEQWLGAHPSSPSPGAPAIGEDAPPSPGTAAVHIKPRLDTRASEAAALDQRLSPHGFAHAFAPLCAAAGGVLVGNFREPLEFSTADFRAVISTQLRSPLGCPVELIVHSPRASLSLPPPSSLWGSRRLYGGFIVPLLQEYRLWVKILLFTIAEGGASHVIVLPRKIHWANRVRRERTTRTTRTTATRLGQRNWCVKFIDYLCALH